MTLEGNNVLHIQSRANPLIKQLRQLAHSSSAGRKQGRIWLEGDHLCRAALAKGFLPEIAVFSASNWPSALCLPARAAIKMIVIPDTLMQDISPLPSPAPVAFVLGLPEAPPALLPKAATVILDRVQDAGNVGSILRSAAAFGFEQIIALQGTAALWSPKVLRAGMGAHFALRLIEGVQTSDLAQLNVPIVVTSSHQGLVLPGAQLPFPCAWAMGHEGQGVSEELLNLAQHRVRIAQPGGEESLNVAAAAAICLYASFASIGQGK